jgi:hypothetical protein
MIDLSKVDIFGNETGTINTANCYVVREDGDYCFPLVYGNGIKDGKDNKEAYTTNKSEEDTLFLNYVDHKGRTIKNPYIKDRVEKASVIWKSDGIKIKKIKCKNNYLYFTIKHKKAKQGENALIGIYDEEYKVIWSWHIWFYEGNDLEVIPIKDRIKYKKIPKHIQHQILSINLGWNGETNTFYQWGRKDPFRSDVDEIFIMEDNYNSSIRVSILNPNKFFTDYDGFEGYVNLWDSRCDGFVNKDKQCPNHSRLSIKTIYDPCPPGFKVPGCDVFGELDKLGSLWKNYGRMFGGSIFFPASGGRSRGSCVNCASSYGYYWSSASDSQAYAYGLYFYAKDFNPVYDFSRASGFSVRPVKEYG